MGHSGQDPYENEPVYILDYHAPVSGAGHVVFRVYEESDAKRLEVQAATHWALEDRDPERRRREQDVLDAYFTELVRAIRMEWEPVDWTVTELYEQSFRRVEAGEKPIDVFRKFYLPNLPESEQPKDASQTADAHNAWKSAMSAWRKRKGKG